MNIGDRVKPSAAALREKRDRWLGLQGRAHLPEGRYAKVEYDIAKDRRGTVVEVDSRGCSVEWDDGGSSSCLLWLVEKA